MVAPSGRTSTDGVVAGSVTASIVVGLVVECSTGSVVACAASVSAGAVIRRTTIRGGVRWRFVPVWGLSAVFSAVRMDPASA